MIPVKVEKISYHPSSRSYAVLLKDESSELFLPILVGSFEAQSIALAIEVVDTPRPLTHDLICDLITKVVKGLSENPDDNSKIEKEVRDEVINLTSSFPIYKNL